MTDVKKLMKRAAIISLVLNVVNIASLLMAIFYEEFSVFAIVEESICIVLTFVTSIIYFVLMKKSKDYILSKKTLIWALSWINLLNSIFVWAISLWVAVSISNATKITTYENPNKPDDGSIVLDESEYKVSKEAEDLTEGLKELDKLRKKEILSEEEYGKLKQGLINKFLDKNK